MRKKLISLISLLALPIAYAQEKSALDTISMTDTFDTLFAWITPTVANYLYTFVLTFAVAQFALELVLSKASVGTAGDTLKKNNAVIAGALAFGASYFAYITRFDMILNTAPYFILITIALVLLMVYRVGSLFGGGSTAPRYMKFAGLAGAFFLLGFFLQTFLSYSVYYEELAGETIAGTTLSIIGFARSISTLGTIIFALWAIVEFMANQGTAVNLGPFGPSRGKASFTMSPNPVNLTVPVHVTDTSKAKNITQWEWDWGDGTPATIIAAPGPGDTDHTYLAPGDFDIKLTVTTPKGTDSTTQQIKVNPIGALNANFTVHAHDTFGGGGTALPLGPPFEPAPADIFFDGASSTSVGATIDRYRWAVTATAGGPAPPLPALTPVPQNQMKFTNPGTYEVTLIVEDSSTGANSTPQPITFSLG